MKIKEKYPKKLLVEGEDDQSVIWALCGKFAVTENFDVIDCGSDSKILSEASIRIKLPEVETLGLILDADEDIEKRWLSIKDKITSFGYNLPEKISNEGLVVQNSSQYKVRFGLWIMPNNKIKGRIEDFIKFLIPAEDKLQPKAEKITAEIEKEDLNLYSIDHHSKALIHTWLAWQKKPGQKMGTAITATYLNTEEQNCQLFINWLKELYA